MATFDFDVYYPTIVEYGFGFDVLTPTFLAYGAPGYDTGTTPLVPASKPLLGDHAAPPKLLQGKTYYQRAYNTVLGQYVYWTTAGYPDATGASSGYPVANLTAITVVSSS